MPLGEGMKYRLRWFVLAIIEELKMRRKNNNFIWPLSLRVEGRAKGKNFTEDTSQDFMKERMFS
jgi:hypothetical protein